MDKRYQVFVSSTFTDLKEERKAIIETLLNANYIPAGMEMFSASNDEQFEYIKKIIDACDYYIIVIGARYGTINPTTGFSFTEQEYDYAFSKNIPILAFLYGDPYNLPADKRDDDKREKLEKFRDKVSNNRLCKIWDSVSELVSSVVISLNQETSVNPQLGWIRGSNDNIIKRLEQTKKFENEEKGNKVVVANDYISSEVINKNEAEILLAIDFAKVIYTGRTGEYKFQINFRISAKNKDVFISDVRLKCNDCVFTSQDIKILWFFRKTEKDLLLLDDNKFKLFFAEEKKQASSISELRIEKDYWYFYTISDYIESERLPDGYEDFSTDKWKFVFEYNDKKKVEINFKFEIHNNSPRYPVEWRYDGFC